jgi:MSHA biogenesis protein MshO
VILRRSCGVTLIELVIVLVITAILVTMIALFATPMFSYFDARRRGEVTDLADTALRRMGRDLRSALPNSVRVSNDNLVVELLLVRTAGRYRFDATGGTGTCGVAGDALRFGAADSCFESIGLTNNIPSVAEIATGAFYVVVNNLQPGTAQADAYGGCSGSTTTGCNSAQLSAMTSQTITFASTKLLYESPGSRFQIIEGPVMYVCDTGSGELRRYSGYAIQPGSVPPTPSGTNSLLVNKVSSCAFTYSPNTVAQANGLVTLELTLSTTDVKGNAETVTLYHAVHVSNVP